MDKIHNGDIGEEIRKTRIVEPMPKVIPIEVTPEKTPVEVPIEVGASPVKK